MPTPDEIRKARSQVKMTQVAAASVIKAKERTWQEWEGGRRNMPGAKWELWKLRVGLL